MGSDVKITALIPAAGFGERMKLDLAKPLVKLKAKPIIIYTLEIFESHPLIDEIVLIFNKEGLQVARDFVKEYKLKKVVRVIAGGATKKRICQEWP